jgi:hypothetical protein
LLSDFDDKNEPNQLTDYSYNADGSLKDTSDFELDDKLKEFFKDGKPNFDDEEFKKLLAAYMIDQSMSKEELMDLLYKTRPLGLEGR